MTAAALADDLRALARSLDDLTERALSGAPVDAVPLEREAARLSEALTALPAAEARTMLPLLEAAIAKLDRLSAEMRAKGVILPAGEGETEPAPKRAARAVSAYKTTSRY